MVKANKVFKQHDIEELLKTLFIDDSKTSDERLWNSAIRSVGKGLDIKMSEIIK